MANVREPAKLPSLVDDTLTIYESRLKTRGISLVRRYRGDGVALAAPSEVKQVIANLLGNAIDAERSGGRIDVRVSSCQGQKYVRLTIADRGCGMTEEHQRQIFDPFFTTKEDMGTGLGLWITKQIVDAHGGAIHARSRLGRGTVFVVNWPVAETRANEALASS